jgi:heterodisulfide reductase subunit B
VDYAASVAGVTPLLDVELEEVADWNCCGATAAHSINPEVALALSARNLLLAEQKGRDVVAPCALCFNRLKVAEKALKNPAGNDLGASYEGALKIWDLLDYLTQDYYLPVYYFTELIGLALGHPQVKDWLAKHLVDPVPLLREKNLI